MAHESSNPKVKVLILAAIGAAISLALFDVVFRSYYTAMMEGEESEKVLTVAPKQLIELRAAEQQRLTAAALPIDRAMKELATRGREDPALKKLSAADITPEPSNDNGAVVGWGLLVTAPPAAATPGPTDHLAAGDAGPTSMGGGDGGTPLATDSGAHAVGSDAGAAPAPHANALPNDASAGIHH